MLFILVILLLPGVLYGQPLAIEPSELDLGPVKIDVKVQGEIRLSNQSDDELEIVVTINGDGFTATPDTLRLSSKSASAIVVYFTAATVGPATGMLTLRVKSFFKDETFTVPLRASAARPAFALLPANRLDFGAVQIGASATDAFTIKNIGAIPATSGQVVLANPQAPYAIQQTIDSFNRSSFSTRNV